MAVLLLYEFYTTVVSNEVVCHKFLVKKGLLKSDEVNTPFHKCSTQMHVKQKKFRNEEWLTISQSP